LDSKDWKFFCIPDRVFSERSPVLPFIDGPAYILPPPPALKIHPANHLAAPRSPSVAAIVNFYNRRKCLLFEPGVAPEDLSEA
jgi:hypothetical protein